MSNAVYYLVLLRHGQSIWNKENRFTGWMDIDLTDQGRNEARQAGEKLRERQYSFDVVFTSVQRRSIETVNILLQYIKQKEVPVYTTWRLNERHYGALQGLSKTDISARFGESMVMGWRRSFSSRPPALEFDDRRHARFNPCYSSMDPNALPRTESLEDTLNRLLPYWDNEITAQIRAGQKVLVVAHGNSLRALVKHLDQITDSEFPNLYIPTGIPFVYELDYCLRPIKRYYLR